MNIMAYGGDPFKGMHDCMQSHISLINRQKNMNKQQRDIENLKLKLRGKSMTTNTDAKIASTNQIHMGTS